MTARMKQMGKTCGYYLLMVSGCFFGSFILSCDVYYFIPSGAYIEQYGFPHELMFSVHAGEHFHYIMQQWLFALWNWKVYQAFGLYGVLFCGYLTNIAFLLLLHRLLLCVSGGRRGLAFTETFLAGFFVLMLDTGRPYTLTCCFLLIELIFLQQLRAHPALRRCGYVLFPLLSVLEINLHAAMWPMLLIFLLPYFFESTLGRLTFFLLAVVSLLFVLLCAVQLFRRRAQAAALASGNLRLTTAILAFFLLPLFALKWQPPQMVSPALARSADILLAEEQPSALRLYTGYDEGGYMEFRGIPSYLDTRAEVFLPALNWQEDVLKEYLDFIYGRLDYREFQQRNHFTHLLTTDDDPLYTYLAADPDYVLLYDSAEDDSHSEVQQQEKKRIRLYAYRPAVQ